MSLMGFSDHLLGNLETLIEDADAAGATEVAERARQLRDEARPGLPWGIDEPEDEDRDDWDEFADPFDVSDVMSPMRDMAMDLAAAIVSGNESAIEKVRQTALQRGMPKEEFEEMLNRFSPILTNSPGHGNRRKSGASAGDEAQTMFDFGES